MTIKLRIETREDWLNMYYELQKVGLLKNVNVHDVCIYEGAFPMEIDVDIEPLLKLVSSPMVKPFKGKIDAALQRQIGQLILNN